MQILGNRVGIEGKTRGTRQEGLSTRIKVKTVDDSLGLFGNLGDYLFFNCDCPKGCADSSQKDLARSPRKMEEDVHD
jgi:hypothetical protein